MRESTVFSGSVAELITAAEPQSVVVMMMVTKTLTLSYDGFLQE